MAVPGARAVPCPPIAVTDPSRTAALTHHEILAVAAPLLRRGRRVDLGATDRSARRIAFHARAHPGDGARPPLQEALVLEDVGEGRWTLTRTLSPPDGPAAQFAAQGTDAARLLEAIEAVGPEAQVIAADGWLLARSLRQGPGDEAPRLARGTVRVGGLELTLKVPTVSGISADLSLVPLLTDDPIALPDDLLAVLGAGWSRLDRSGAGWSATLGLRGRGADRYRNADMRLRQAAEHLARTLSAPPQAYHRTHRAARWRVAARRAVPLTASLALMAGAAAFPALGLAQDSPIRLLVFSSPPLLLALLFCLREMPRIEIPPLPRAPSARAWREPPPAPSRSPA